MSRAKEIEAKLARIWTDSLRLDGKDLRESAIVELMDHWKIDRATCEKRLQVSEEELAEDFAKRGLDPKKQEDLIRFYNEQELEAFELMSYHVERGHEVRGALKYVVALEAAKRKPGRRYLDVGSGVGSGAIVFARAGFTPTLADVADPLLGFARARLERRGIQASYVDLKKDQIPDGSQDFITCLDVLEHVSKPLEQLEWCRKKLAPGGTLAVFAAFGKDEDNPLHVVHDRTLHRRFRSCGFEEDATASRFAYELGLKKFYFLTPVERSAFGSAFVGAIDAWTPTFLRGLKLKAKGDPIEVS